MTQANPSGLSQAEQALSTAATHVETARGDVAQRCAQLSERVAELSAGWGGRGATSFVGLMAAWQDRQRTILQALDGLAGALRETERDNVATDEAAAGTSARLLHRLG